MRYGINCLVYVLLKLTLDLIEEWLSKHMNEAVLLGGVDGGLSISGIAPYQPSDGLMELKVVMNPPMHATTVVVLL